MRAFEHNRELAPPTGRWTIGDVAFLHILTKSILNDSGETFTEEDFSRALDEMMAAAYERAGY